MEFLSQKSKASQLVGHEQFESHYNWKEGYNPIPANVSSSSDLTGYLLKQCNIMKEILNKLQFP